ncbi:hypothetical protein BC828DRAFT_351222 [Blastocladiella britannica]|nr:hypothetical protein BC828DRAFT_351222 [Blastocladiella britannica]
MIVNDFTDADALPRRMAARPGHLSAAANMLESGVLVAGGAVLDSHDTSGRMTGSVFLLAGLESADHVRAAFANDPYVVGRVWNMESAEIVQVDLAGLGKLVAAAA